MPRHTTLLARHRVFRRMPTVAALLCLVQLKGLGLPRSAQTGPIRQRLDAVLAVRAPSARLKGLSETLEAAHAAGDRYGEAECDFYIGKDLELLYRWDEARQSFEKAERLYEAAGHHRDAGVAGHEAGVASGRSGQWLLATGYFHEANHFELLAGDVAGRAATLLEMGGAYDQLGRRREALNACEEALKLFHTVDRHREAIAFNYIGRIQEELGDRRQALNSYAAALPLFERAHDDRGIAETLTNQGVTWGNLGQEAAALECYRKALPRWGSDLSGKSATFNDIGKAQKESGEYTEALDYYGHALAIRRTIGDISGQAVTINNIGRIKVEQGRSREAIALYAEALALERQTGHRDAEAITLRNSGYAWRRLGADRLAIAVAKQSVNVFQSLRAELKGLGKSSERSYAVEVTPAYRFLADELIAMGRLAEAEEVMGLLKDEEYFTFLRSAKSQDVDLTPSEAAWKSKYDALGGDLAKDATDFEALVSLERTGTLTPTQLAEKTALSNRLSAARAAFSAFLKGAASTFADARADNDRISELKGSAELAKVVQSLPGRHAAIYTLVTQDGVRTVLTLPHVTELKQGQAMNIRFADLSRKIEALRIALTNPALDPTGPAADLYDILIRPIEQELQAAGVKSLMWSLDGPLRYLPVAALYDRKTHQFLIDKYACSLFNPSNVVDLVSTPNPHPTAVGFGVSKPHVVGSLQFAGLTGVGSELATLHRLFGAKVYEDVDFTESVLKNTLDLPPSILHLATHFRLAPGNASESFLLLGDGKPLAISEFANWRLNALDGVDVFVLSACDTATPAGSDTDGGEIESFSRAAQENGAASVLATLWPVNDSSTSLLISKFYELRSHGGTTKVEALAQAQRWLRTASSGEVSATHRGSPLKMDAQSKGMPTYKPDPSHPFAHPYYWAPFVLTGNVK